MFLLRLFFIIFLSSHAFANVITVDKDTAYQEILSHSEILIDNKRNLTIDKVLRNNIKFKENKKNILSLGYSPNIDVWIKFSIKNSSNIPITKVIEYSNPLTASVEFYDYKNRSFEKKLDGLVQTNISRTTVNPTFNILLEANEEKTYYIKASSYITTLIIKLNLWDNNTFNKKEIKHQIVLSLFFGAMFILGIYNLFIFFFTKDVSYLYYVFYIIGVIIHHLLYIGFANIYLFNQETMALIMKLAPLIVALPIYALGFFSKSFLKISQYPIHNKILNTFLIIIPISIIILLFIENVGAFRNILTMILLIYLMYLAIFTKIKKSTQANYILLGWFIFLSSGMFMFLSSAGIFNMFKYFPYYVELTLALEALVFSIALADRINSLQKERNEANKKLLLQKQNETQRLSIQVDEKTKDLKEALDEKSILLKELNHRVKNNMQTIVSLIRLQGDEIEDEKSQEILNTIQNRINAMSHLHELLYKQENLSHINTYEYFEILIEEVNDTYYDEDIDIHFNIKTDLRVEDAIYCGLILNELITNSFKYAFPEGQGNIYISLEKIDNKTTLTVSDDGIGYSKSKPKDSLGLTLVDTLIKHQLKGEIKIDSSNGVKVIMTWGKDEN